MAAASRADPEVTLPGFEVLLAVASGHGHGYAVMRFLETATQGAARLGPGTLYRTIARLLADELLRESAAHDPRAPHDARRRYYELTPAGRRVLRREAALHARLAAAASAAGLLDDLDLDALPSARA